MRLLVPLCAAFVLASCAPAPRSVAERFVENLAKGKISEAKKVSTDQTAKMLDLVSSFGSLPVEPDYKFVFVDEEVDGNKATVRFKDSKTQDVSEIKLVKVDGQWKVHFESDFKK